MTEQCARGKAETVSIFAWALSDSPDPSRSKDEFGLWQLHFPQLLAPHVLGQAQSPSGHLLLPACLSQVCHKASGHLLFLTLCQSCSFLPVLFLCLDVFILSPTLLFHIPPLLRHLPLHRLSALSRALGPQQLSCHSLADLVISFSSLLPFFGNRLRYSRTVFWLEAVFSQASLFPWAPLCSFVHGAECRIRNIDFAHTVFPFLSLSLPLFPFPSFSCILHILCALEQCHSLSLITNQCSSVKASRQG